MRDIRVMLEELELGALSFQGSYLSAQTEMTMTLKEITDLLGVRHNNAMRAVAEMALNPDFGAITQIEYSYKMPTGDGRLT